MRKKQLVGSWIAAKIKAHVKKMAKLQGITVSEYIRALILDDLDKRTFFADVANQQTKLQRLGFGGCQEFEE